MGMEIGMVMLVVVVMGVAAFVGVVGHRLAPLSRVKHTGFPPPVGKRLTGDDEIPLFRDAAVSEGRFSFSAFAPELGLKLMHALSSSERELNQSHHCSSLVIIF